MRRAALALIVLAALISSPALAQQLDYELSESSQHFTLGLRVGAMFIIADEFKDIYGEEPLMAYGLSFGYKLVHHLEVIGEAGYANDRGTGVDPSGNKTGEDYRLHFAPASLGLLYRFDFAHEQVVVPYIGAGGDGAFYYEERIEGGDRTDGGVYGWHGVAGVQFLMDPLDRRAADNLEGDWGINDVYFVIEGRYAALDDFGKNQEQGKGNDLTHWFVSGGLMFQF
ncbi:MAG: MXAN_2562 family outer membrane beta-barrel protein [Candidatus Alcyoniella australis]|nr:MXAN_2562 family outer membrane beta-barrel protein [Candidatus Alcyoniella australis]